MDNSNLVELSIFQIKLKNSEEIKNIIAIIYRVQTYDSVMSGYVSIGLIDFMLTGKSLLYYTNLFSPNDF